MELANTQLSLARLARQVFTGGLRVRRDAVAIGPRLQDLAVGPDWTDRRRRPVEVSDQQTEHSRQQEGENRETARPRRDPSANGLLVGRAREMSSAWPPMSNGAQLPLDNANARRLG